MKPKLSDIAQNLSVSSATVSLALSGKGRVSRDLVEKIEAEARRIGYTPNNIGKALRTGRSNVIGLVLPDVANPLFPRMARSIVRAAEAQGYGVLIADSQASRTMQDEAIRRLIDFGSDGIVVIPRKGTQVSRQPIPVAVIDTPNSRLNVASADHAAGGAIAVRHLQEMGHRRILCIGANRSSLVQRLRVDGMAGAADAGTTATQHWMEDGPDVPALVRRGATAIAATSDLIALQLLTELGETGLRVAQDVSLVGFDDLDFGRMITPGLTTIGTSEIEIATRAIADLKRLIEGASAVENTVVPMHLVRRGTVTDITSGGEEK